MSQIVGEQTSIYVAPQSTYQGTADWEREDGFVENTIGDRVKKIISQLLEIFLVIITAGVSFLIMTTSIGRAGVLISDPKEPMNDFDRNILIFMYIIIAVAGFTNIVTLWTF